jgi:hypothetical protein
MDKLYCVFNIKCVGEYFDSNLIVTFASLWLGHFDQFTIGQVEATGLCILMSPLQVGGIGFIFMNFHLCSLQGMCWYLESVVCFFEKN